MQKKKSGFKDKSILLKFRNFLFRDFQFTKRHKFVALSVVATVGMLVVQALPFEIRYIAILGLVSFVSILTLSVLWPDMAGVKYWILLILPSAFTAAVALFYFLLPVRWATRLPVALGYGICFYLLLLTLNIFNVAAIRTIALLRAAHSVGILFTLISSFFIFNVFFSLHFAFWAIFVLVGFTSFLLILQALWSFELEDLISKKVLKYTTVYTLAISQISLGLSFWPIVAIYSALGLTAAIYVFLGLSQIQLQNRLTSRAVWEYAVVATSIIIILVLNTHWG